MSPCCSGACTAAERHFDARRAERDMNRYRKKGPDPTTRLLREGLEAGTTLEGTLLDVGAGVGPLTFELLDAGIASAIAVDASPASIAAGRVEAARLNISERIEWHSGDFVDLAEDLPVADTVTLDRVVCCYAAVEPLLGQALRRARHSVALSYPRDRWYVRTTMSLQNTLRRIRGDLFRTFVHAPDSMEDFIRTRRFDLVSRSSTLAWTADVYARVRS